VLGRDFSYALLSALAGLPENALPAALERLVDADLLYVEGAPPNAAYRFKHALIQDAAYDSLLKSRRQALHRRAAEILRDEPERAAAEPEVIAHHFTQAGVDDLAIEWWSKAGDQALRRSALQEAIAHLGKAVAMADKTAGNETLRPAARLRLQISLSNATMQAHGQHASDVRATFLRARELAAAVDDPIERISAYYGLGSAATCAAKRRR
jgi:predicted ATPase